MSGPTVPASPATPTPPKKKGKGKILLIIAVILVVVCGGIAFAAYNLLGKAIDVAFAEGKCVDNLPTSATAASVSANPVECSDSKAVAKILKVADDKGPADAETVCGTVPAATGYLVITKTNGSTRLLCLGPK